MEATCYHLNVPPGLTGVVIQTMSNTSGQQTITAIIE